MNSIEIFGLISVIETNRDVLTRVHGKGDLVA